MKVLVIGAGIAGLGAATELARAGHQVQVLEATDVVGGRAITLARRRGGDRCDVGAQYYHSTYKRALSLIRDVGLDRTLSKISGSTRFFDNRVLGGSFLVDHRLPWFKAAGVLGNARLVWFSLKQFVAHRMDTFALEHRPDLDEQPALDAIADPWLREFFVRTLHVVGVLAEPDSTRISLLHLLRLMRIILFTDYLALSGGAQSLHQALADRLDVRLEAPASQLIVEGSSVVGVALEGSEQVLQADQVVVATQAPRAAKLLPEEWREEREFLGAIRMPPAILVSLFLDRPLERGVWSYMVQAGQEEAVSFFTDGSQKNPAMVPSGNAVLQAWICYPASVKLHDEADDMLVAIVRGEAEEYFPGVGSWIDEAYVTRHAQGVPWHPAGHHGRALDFLRHADQRQGVSFCGDYFSGGYLEPALWSAERVVRQLVQSG